MARLGHGMAEVRPVLCSPQDHRLSVREGEGGRQHLGYVWVRGRGGAETSVAGFRNGKLDLKCVLFL